MRAVVFVRGDVARCARLRAAAIGCDCARGDLDARRSRTRSARNEPAVLNMPTLPTNPESARRPPNPTARRTSPASGGPPVLLAGIRKPTLPRMCIRLLSGIWISGTTSQFVVAPLDEIAIGDELHHRRPSAAESAFRC